MSSTTHHAETLGDLVARDPGAGTLFEQLGIDYCCSGRRTLAEACSQHGLDPDTIVVVLDAVRAGRSRPQPEEHDVAGASISGLCDHIVQAHHEPLRTELPRIADLLATVVRVHGAAGHPELLDLQRTFLGMQSELVKHIDAEEQILFPACRALDSIDSRAGVDDPLLAHLEDDHAAVGAALCALRELSGGYDADAALCGTHRRLLRSLQALETDLHQHLHEENNLLFRHVRTSRAA
jgi:regulator of cell morphogenesis and NO signaling